MCSLFFGLSIGIRVRRTRHLAAVLNAQKTDGVIFQGNNRHGTSQDNNFVEPIPQLSDDTCWNFSLSFDPSRCTSKYNCRSTRRFSAR